MSYRAIKTGWVRGGFGCFLGVPMLFVLGAGAMLLTLESVAGVLGALLCLTVVLLCIAMGVIGTRLQFTVDDDGITLLHYVRTRRIRWEEIAVIEQSSFYWTSGATVIVLRNPPGQRITALATTDRVALYRGEIMIGWNTPDRQLRPPAQAAIDGHRRWLARQAR